MPSVDHCMNKPSEMTTLTNSLEVFDTYKHREDKDSDEESFHLPLDDDESETKYQEAVKTGSSNETEDDILNKFESTTAALEPIDSQLEERLLNEDEEEKNVIKENGIDDAKPHCSQDSTEICDDDVKPALEDETLEDETTSIEPSDGGEKDILETNGDVQKDVSEINEDVQKDVSEINEDVQKDVSETNDDVQKDVSETNDDVTVTDDVHMETQDPLENKTNTADENGVDETNTTEVSNDETEKHSKENEEKEEVAAKLDEIVASDDVPKIDIDTNLENNAINIQEESKDTEPITSDKPEDDCQSENVADKPNEDILAEVDEVVKNDTEQEATISQDDAGEKASPSDCEMKEDIASNKEDKDNEEQTKIIDKCENSNDSPKDHNEDSEDLFDISVIRDAAEDNAETAYNEAHPEEGHDDEYDDQMDDKGDEDSNSDKAANLEEEEEEESHEDQLKNDDVDIEETNLKLDCDGKDTVSDGESDNRNVVTGTINQVQDTNKTPTSDSAKESVIECRLDEVTGNLIAGDSLHTSYSEDIDDGMEKRMDVDDPEKRKSLKRAISEESEGGVTKKLRTEPVEGADVAEPEKPKEKLPLRTLLSLSEFMRGKKSKRLTMHDLEEFCLQKICEVIVHKSDLGDVHHQLKLQEQLIESMRKEIQQLTKQARDLEIVNKKLMNDLKQQTATQKPLNPLKITRSVGLQVKFTPAFDANMKRRQSSTTLATQKVQVPAPNRVRNIPNSTTPVTNRQKAAVQATSPQKQPQSIQKSTPLLSQALQTRRVVLNDPGNKSMPQMVRAKAPDPKAGAPSASVIDLTDEDDKKDKNKSIPQKMITQKNIVPLRTTPVRVSAPQGIRLATSQGKVSPITSVVTSSAPQVMYVVQSSPQNVLSSGLGPKAVVVNFQSANGVLTSTLNGSAVSVIPKQSNTIQLKAVAPPKPMTTNKVMKVANKHPAPLPSPPVVRVSLDKPLKPIPPKPHLTIRKTDTGIILQWKMPYELDMYEVIASYQLYAYQETSALPSTDMWRKVGDVKALALPMACTLTQFADKNKYYFAVRPVDIHKRIGLFSEPEEISL